MSTTNISRGFGKVIYHRDMVRNSHYKQTYMEIIYRYISTWSNWHEIIIFVSYSNNKCSWIIINNNNQIPSPGPVFCLLLGVSSDYAQPITGQVTEVTCPVMCWAQSELTLSKRQKTGPELATAPSPHPCERQGSHVLTVMMIMMMTRYSVVQCHHAWYITNLLVMMRQTISNFAIKAYDNMLKD